MSEGEASDLTRATDRMTGALDPRQSALQKLKQTAHEARVLCASLERVPDELIWQRPAGSASIAEFLWLIHLSDEFRFRPVVDSMVDGHEPRIEHINASILLGTDPAPDNDLQGILRQVIESREKLLERFEAVPPSAWLTESVVEEGIEVTCARFADDIAQHDVEILREIGQRLFESDLR